MRADDEPQRITAHREAELGTSPLSPHIRTLDAVRGIAASLVVVHHFASLVRDQFPPTGVARYALRVLWALGHPSVVVFFVLSGFVLYLSYRQSQQFSTTAFLARRIFRIYPAHLAATALSVFLVLSMDASNLDGLGHYVRNVLPRLGDSASMGRALVLIPAVSGDQKINSVLWSLVHEMRFSLVFPLLAVACRNSPVFFLTGNIALYALARLSLLELGLSPHFFLGDGLVTSLLVSGVYFPTFALGMVAAHIFLKGEVRISGRTELAAAVALGVLALLDVDDLATALAASVVLLVAATGRHARRILHHRLLGWLGDISYALYLVHFPILMFTGYMSRSFPLISFVGALALGIALSLAAATLLHRLIEVPFIGYGSRLIMRYRRQLA